MGLKLQGVVHSTPRTLTPEPCTLNDKERIQGNLLLLQDLPTQFASQVGLTRHIKAFMYLFRFQILKEENSVLEWGVPATGA